MQIKGKGLVRVAIHKRSKVICIKSKISKDWGCLMIKKLCAASNRFI